MSQAFSISVEIPRLNKIRTIYCQGLQAKGTPLHILKTFYGDRFSALLLVTEDLAYLSMLLEECSSLQNAKFFREYATIDGVLNSNFEKQENNYYYYNGQWIRIE